MTHITRILVPTDFSVTADAALEYAFGLAERFGASIQLLHVLDGTVDVTVLTDEGRSEVTLDAGSVFVCPKGLWHRQRPHALATVLFSTPTHTTEASFADDPRSPPM